MYERDIERLDYVQDGSTALWAQSERQFCRRQLPDDPSSGIDDALCAAVMLQHLSVEWECPTPNNGP